MTHASASQTWLRRQSPHRVLISEINLYVFVKDYKPKHQMRKGGKFEIRFAEEQGMLPISVNPIRFSIFFPVRSIEIYLETISRKKGGGMNANLKS